MSRRIRWNHRSGLQEAPVCHTLGILMVAAATRYNLTTQHTHDCLLGRRERVPVRAGLAIPRRVQQWQACWQLAVAGSLTSHTVWSRSGRSSTQVMPIARASMSVLPGARARRTASLACAPVTPLCCGLLCCARMMFMRCWLLVFFLNFYASSRAPDPFLPFLPRDDVDSLPKKLILADSRPEGLGSGGATHSGGEINDLFDLTAVRPLPSNSGGSTAAGVC